MSITLNVAMVFDGVAGHTAIKHPITLELFQFAIMDLDTLLPDNGKRGPGSNEHKKALLSDAFLCAVAFRQMILKSIKAGVLAADKHSVHKPQIALDQIDTAFCMYYAAVTGKVLATSIEWNDT